MSLRSAEKRRGLDRGGTKGQPLVGGSLWENSQKHSPKSTLWLHYAAVLWGADAVARWCHTRSAGDDPFPLRWVNSITLFTSVRSHWPQPRFSYLASYQHAGGCDGVLECVWTLTAACHFSPAALICLKFCSTAYISSQYLCYAVQSACERFRLQGDELCYVCSSEWRGLGFRSVRLNSKAATVVISHASDGPWLISCYTLGSG